jgi:flagellar biosynthesis protein FlhF
MIPAGTVRIKSYFASSVEQAIAQARVELGADALLLNTRKNVESDGTPRYEVTMGVPGSQTSAAQPRSTAAGAPSSAPAAAPIEDDVLAGMSAMREQIAEIQALLAQGGRTQLLKSRLVPDLAQLHQGLLDAQVDSALSLDIMAKLEGIISTDAFFREAVRGQRGTSNRWKSLPPDPRRVEGVLREELERRVRFAATIGVPGRAGGPVVVMVGPTGGGKTTSMVKLASKWAALNSSLPARLISLDVDRPGAREQLHALARPAIRHSFLKALESLPAIIADLREKECLLIDTPGFMAHSVAQAELLAKVLKGCPDLDVHLVIPAYMSAPDFKNTIERYRVFQPAKLLVTKLDEAQAFGTAFSMAAHSGLALSFLADGPRVPEDLHPASADAVLGTMGEWPRASAHHAA